jgi:hypothetical protein
MYGELAEVLSEEQIISAYNNVGVAVNFHGSKLIIEPLKRVNGKKSNHNIGGK